MHPFEHTGLGKSPFKCVGVRKNVYQACPGAPVQPAGTCSHCGTGIMYEYTIVGSDGSRFVVGSDCVMKTGGESEVEGFRNERLKLERAKRNEKREQQRAVWAAQRLLENAAAAERFAFDFPDVVIRLENPQTDWEREMAGKLKAWGALSEGQVNALKRGWAFEDAKRLEQFTSRYISEVGKRYTNTFTINHVTSTQISRFPLIISYWHLMKDSAGNVCVYRGSRFLGKRGESVQATFTVKEYSEYKGTKQTVLARPKLIETETEEKAA